MMKFIDFLAESYTQNSNESNNTNFEMIYTRSKPKKFIVELTLCDENKKDHRIRFIAPDLFYGKLFKNDQSAIKNMKVYETFPETKVFKSKLKHHEKGVYEDYPGRGKGKIIGFGNEFADLFGGEDAIIENVRKQCLEFCNRNHITQTDKEFTEKFNNLLNDIDEFCELNNDVIMFKSNDIGSIKFNGTEDDFRDIVKKTESVFNMGLSDISNESQILSETGDIDDGETTSDTQDGKLYEQQENNVSDGINNLMNNLLNVQKSDSRYYACTVGGGSRSDTIVVKDNKEYTTNNTDKIAIKTGRAGKTKTGGYRYNKELLKLGDNDKYFYIESKLNHSSSQYLKFLLDIHVDKDNVRIDHRLFGDKASFETYNETLEHLLRVYWNNEKSISLQNMFQQILQLNKQIAELKNIDPTLSGELTSIKQFPEGFKTLAKVFDYYVYEWTKKYLRFKQLYLKAVVENDIDKIKSIEQQAGVIFNRIKEISGDNVLKRMLSGNDISYYEKSKRLIFKFIDNRNEQNNCLLSRQFNKGSKKFFNIIENYYYNKMGVRYIVIGNECYILQGEINNIPSHGGTVCGDNPLNLKNVKNFNTLANMKMMLRVNLIYDGKQQKEKLKLDIRIGDDDNKTPISVQDVESIFKFNPDNINFTSENKKS